MESKKFGIVFYKDKNGREPVQEYIDGLLQSDSKDSRIKVKKITLYFRHLEEKGPYAGEPFVKHLKNEIWELRPLRDRFLFAAWINGTFVILHHFVKKTQKTPAKEIATAERRLDELKRRLKNEHR